MKSFFPCQFTNFSKKNSHSLTNFTVNRNHVTTVVSKVEILSSFVRDFRSSAQNFVCTSESSIHGSEQSVLIVSLELPSSTVRNPVTTGSPKESSVSCSFWTEVQWECVHCSSCVQVRLRPTKPRRQLVAPTSKPPSENELAEVSYVCSNGTPVIIPFVTIPTVVPRHVCADS